VLWCCCSVLQEFRRNAFNTDSVDEALDLLNFCYKIVERSGLSAEGTYLPKAIHPKVCVPAQLSCMRVCRTLVLPSAPSVGQA
jgi:hypothetical protein